MLSRLRSIDNALAAAILLALLGGFWWIRHVKRASEIAELRQHIPPTLANARLVAYCNESGFYALDQRAIFAVAPSGADYAPRLGIGAGKREWIAGEIPASAFYNETSTFICPRIPQYLRQRILLAAVSKNNFRHPGTHSLFWLPQEGLLVVHYYND